MGGRLTKPGAQFHPLLHGAPMFGTALDLLAPAAATLFIGGAHLVCPGRALPALLPRGLRRIHLLYAAAHGFLATWVVGPPMLLELATAGWLALRPHRR